METERVKRTIQLDSHENLSNLLRANGNSLIHPRTQQFIVGTSLLTAQRPPIARGNGNLNRFPAVAFESKGNQRIRKGYRFILNDTGIQAQKYDYDSEEWRNISSDAVRYTKSSQYKTVWFSRRSRRQ